MNALSTSAARIGVPTCLALLALICSCAEAQSGSLPDQITGYGGYRFGMNLSEAQRVDPRARLTKCSYTNTAFCLEREDRFFGETATIVVQFAMESKQLSQVIIAFRRLEGVDGACGSASKTVLGALFDRFGSPTTHSARQAQWYARKGGSVGFLQLCMDDDKGMVVVSYTPSAGF